RRRIQLRGIALQRVSAELLNVYRYGRREPLRAQNVEAHRHSVDVLPRRQSVFFPRLIARDQRLAVLDSRRGAGKDGNSRFILRAIFSQGFLLDASGNGARMIVALNLTHFIIIRRGSASARSPASIYSCWVRS